MGAARRPETQSSRTVTRRQLHQGINGLLTPKRPYGRALVRVQWLMIWSMQPPRRLRARLGARELRALGSRARALGRFLQRGWRGGVLRLDAAVAWATTAPLWRRRLGAAWAPRLLGAAWAPPGRRLGATPLGTSARRSPKPRLPHRGEDLLGARVPSGGVRRRDDARPRRVGERGAHRERRGDASGSPRLRRKAGNGALTLLRDHDPTHTHTKSVTWRPGEIRWGLRKGWQQVGRGRVDFLPTPL